MSSDHVFAEYMCHVGKVSVKELSCMNI